MKTLDRERLLRRKHRGEAASFERSEEREEGRTREAAAAEADDMVKREWELLEEVRRR